MALQSIVPGLYQLPLGVVNVFLLVGAGGDAGGHAGSVTIIDSGYPGSAVKILAALGELGKTPQDVHHILLTHLHSDHTGSAQALKTATQAQVWMHPTDAELTSQGKVLRPSRPSPRWLYRVFVPLLMRLSPVKQVEPVTIDGSLNDGDLFPAAGGLQVIHAPGHSAGQVVFLWPQHGGVLIAADACGNMPGLGLDYPFIFEDLELGRQTLRKLARLSFEHAVFGHGRPLRRAAEQFRKKWADDD